MARLIDGDALLESFVYYRLGQHGVRREAIERLCEYIDHAPTIDAVPVVRCKECLFRGNPMNCPMCHEEDYYDEDDGFDYIVRDETTDEGYCQKGEREGKK